jgi:hypothetical protein
MATCGSPLATATATSGLRPLGIMSGRFRGRPELLDQWGRKDRKGYKEYKAIPARLARLGHKDQWVRLVLKAQLAIPGQQVHPVHKDHLERLDLKGRKVRLVRLERQALPVQLEQPVRATIGVAPGVPAQLMWLTIR